MGAPFFDRGLHKAPPNAGSRKLIPPPIDPLPFAGTTRADHSKLFLGDGHFHLWRHYKTFCGKDCRDWLHMDARMISEIVDHPNCCAKCAANII
jgi:hypothetical protein